MGHCLLMRKGEVYILALSMAARAVRVAWRSPSAFKRVA
jgi:hypothetical protein